VHQRFAEIVAAKQAHTLLTTHSKEQTFEVDVFDITLAAAVKKHLEEEGHLVTHSPYSSKLCITRMPTDNK
jgi:hypothetical protein